jgi:magnesium transporter
MISINVHGEPNGRFRRDVPVAQLEELARRPDDLLWIDIQDPSPAEIARIGEQFQLHPLALEDAARFRQRPKVDQYDTFLMIVFFALSWPADAGPQTQELHLFVGANYLITIHQGELPAIAATAKRWSQHPHTQGKQQIGLLVYALLDAIVDDYFPVIDTLAERTDELEQAIFDAGDVTAQARIFALKKDLLAMRRVVAPERDVMNVLVRRDTPLFGDREIVYFQDVYDHVLRVTDAIDLYRELLSSALDASMSLTAHRLNKVMRTLTASSIILMSVTVVASIYGMNFDYMPELHWALGYPWALGLMLLIAGSLLALFRHIDWL